MQDWLELLYNHLNLKVLVACEALSTVTLLNLKTPFGNEQDLVSQSTELYMWIIFAEVINCFFSKERINIVEAITKPHKGDVIMYYESQ